MTVKWCVVVIRLKYARPIEMTTTPARALEILNGNAGYPADAVSAFDLDGNALSIDQLMACQAGIGKDFD